MAYRYIIYHPSSTILRFTEITSDRLALDRASLSSLTVCQAQSPGGVQPYNFISVQSRRCTTEIASDL